MSHKRLLSNFGIVKDNKMITSEVGLNAFCVIGWLSDGKKGRLMMTTVST